MKYIFLIIVIFVSSVSFAWADAWENLPPIEKPTTSSNEMESQNSVYEWSESTSVSDGSFEKVEAARLSRERSSASVNDTNIYNNTLTNEQLRKWEVDMYSIPRAIAGMVEILIWIAGTIAIAALIYHAVQMQINSGITGDSSWVDKAKKWMFGSLIGFVIALLSWFLVTRLVEILTNAT